MSKKNRRWRTAFIAAIATGVVTMDADGQTSDHGMAPTAHAARATAAVRLDGRLDDTAWAAAAPATAFTQREPREGEPASEATEVRIVYDDVAIYVGARLHDRSGAVSARLGRRDQDLAGSDWFTVAFDSYHDHLTEYRFSVNPSGVRRDEKRSGGEGDDSWDPIWEASASRDDEGWTVELRIPLSQLRFRDESAQSWGIQLIREISRNNEESWFAFTPKRERSGVARFGHLEGLADLAVRGRLELMPYAVTRASYGPVARSEDVDFRNPFTNGADRKVSAGIDLKYRLASSLTLDATVNPDFGQVEVDPAVINLSAFETRFEERRPFFVEGADIFRFGGEGSQLFYSRRIGAPPVGRVPSDAVYNEVPESSTIVAAAKLTGKAGNWSVGLLDGVTARERAEYVTEDEEFAQAVVAPWTNHLVGRAQREWDEGTSKMGGLFTALHRRLDEPALTQRVRSAAYAGGLDFSHDWNDRAWSVSGFAVGSHIIGDPVVITSAQRSSARYYQRPDAAHLELDPTARTMSGFSGRMEISKEAGEHWRGGMSVATTSPAFETNDLGFQSRADHHSARVSVEYVQEQPGRVLREWNLDFSPDAEWNYDGDRLSTQLSLEGSAQLLNYWGGDFELRHEIGGLDDRLTRGGPLARVPARTSYALTIESDPRRRWTIDSSIDHSRGAAGSSTELDVELGFKPAPNWSVSLSPTWSRDRSAAQFVTSVADSTARATFGRRYIFSGLTETELSLAARVSVTFRPDLSFELFARPFLGSGRFGEAKQLAAPRTFRFNAYDGSVEDENFTFRSLRGNAVMRWEWRPGSTLFLVWHQQREAEVALGDLVLSRDLRMLGRTQPENIFTLKISYWINP